MAERSEEQPVPDALGSGAAPVAVIAGATGGIGEACARALAARGFALVLNARREQPLRELADELGAEAVPGDCGDERVAADCARRAGAIDVLVHAAGVLRGSRVREQSVEVFDEVQRANLRSAYVMVHGCLPRISVGGRIVLVSSLSATSPMRGLTAYSAAKAGMNAFALALAAELEPEGINVSLASPGAIDTPMMDNSVNEFSALPASDVGDVVAWLAQLPPRMVIHDVVFRAPFRGPFVAMAGGKGTEGLDLASLRATKNP
ncbi:MAG TPA: SDR family oxidoreductase [Baekduia sp.]|uniref:SDR family oxidoreductase n=1 Tax=Baekduia sp. TaxID=2600305 RepID=UPI002BFDB42F|nr:SDR family oxidoreductase [Baekduia sp.]HMJ37838.1 SDR family oxidoreductase [Baekduia sp.]